jgi:uncharacterized membrane protein SirB2
VKDSLHPWFLLFHFIGLALLASLSLNVLALRGDLQDDNMPALAGVARYLGRMDRVVLAGAGILLLSGIGLMWSDTITLGDAFSSRQPWLGIKLVLFAVLVVDGAALAGPSIRDRARLLHSFEGQRRDQLGAEQQSQLHSSYTRMQISSIPMIVLILAIIIAATFTPFTANPP